ncbi:hypothetical protein C8F04DRAFT_593249 [Mycena alexandri]|uniref:Uncharacterized protein n=1 Tax=Mycena alexandri TaxID=1745969 RepID=A0AAD6XE59_9AGAR|nr:hypothetical protein C8F04DRAFT_593249 [Mycena alexandri]
MRCRFNFAPCPFPLSLPKKRPMDIRIILNPGAVGTPPKAAVAQQRSNSKPSTKKKTKSKVTSRRGTLSRVGAGAAAKTTPTPRATSLSGAGSAIRLRSSSSTAAGEIQTRTNQNSYAYADEYEYATPVPVSDRRSSSLRHRRPPASSSPLVRQARPRKRDEDAFEVHLRGEEGDRRNHKHHSSHNPSPNPTPARGAQTGTPGTSKRRRRTSSRSSSATTVSESAPAALSTLSPSLHSRSRSHASILLSRAREHVALETSALGGRRTRSFMDVVMDLKGPAAADVDVDVVMLFADGEDAAAYDEDGGRGGGDGGFVLTADGALEAYWAGQAAIWVGVGSGASEEDESDLDGSSSSSTNGAHITLTRFPVSMERSTARATWESASQ